MRYHWGHCWWQCRFLSAAEASHGGGAGHARTLESTSSRGRKRATLGPYDEVPSFAPSACRERAAHSRTAARKMSTNALIKDWAKGGKEKMCVLACPADAQAPSLSPKTHLCALGVPQRFSAARQGRCRDASCRCVWPCS